MPTQGSSVANAIDGATALLASTANMINDLNMHFPFRVVVTASLVRGDAASGQPPLGGQPCIEGRNGYLPAYHSGHAVTFGKPLGQRLFRAAGPVCVGAGQIFGRPLGLCGKRFDVIPYPLRLAFEELVRIFQ
jgi:hypothetical protein